LRIFHSARPDLAVVVPFVRVGEVLRVVLVAVDAAQAVRVVDVSDVESQSATQGSSAVGA
jgi:hypothetical protein